MAGAGESSTSMPSAGARLRLATCPCVSTSCAGAAPLSAASRVACSANCGSLASAAPALRKAKRWSKLVVKEPLESDTGTHDVASR
jgi:hypothetical protein